MNAGESAHTEHNTITASSALTSSFESFGFADAASANLERLVVVNEQAKKLFKFVSGLFSLLFDFQPLMRTKVETMCKVTGSIRLRDLEELKSISSLMMDFDCLLSKFHRWQEIGLTETVVDGFTTSQLLFDAILHNLQIFTARISQLFQHTDTLLNLAPPASSFEKRAYGLDLADDALAGKANRTGLLQRPSRVSALFATSTPASASKSGSRVSFSSEYESPRHSTADDSNLMTPGTILKTPLPKGHLLHGAREDTSHERRGLVADAMSVKELRQREYLQRVEFFMLEIAMNTLHMIWQRMDGDAFGGAGVHHYFSKDVHDLADPAATKVSSLHSSVTPSRTVFGSAKKEARTTAKRTGFAGTPASTSTKRRRRQTYSVGDVLAEVQLKTKEIAPPLSEGIFEGDKPPLSVLIGLIHFSITHLKALYQTKHSRKYGALSYLTPMIKRSSFSADNRSGLDSCTEALRVVSWQNIERTLWNVLSHCYTIVLFEWEAYWSDRNAGDMFVSDLKSHSKVMHRLLARFVRFYASLSEYATSVPASEHGHGELAALNSQKDFLEHLTHGIHSGLVDRLRGLANKEPQSARGKGLSKMDSMGATTSVKMSPSYSYSGTPLLTATRSAVASSVGYY